jgi:hypothetical protein
MTLKQFSEDHGRDVSAGLLADINRRAGLAADANAAESTTAPVRLIPPWYFFFLFFIEAISSLSRAKTR